MQTEIKERIPLLDGEGRLLKPGYAKKLNWQYQRRAIKAPSLRIKEWDYYYIGNDKQGIALTIADNSYMALISASFLDFTKPCEKTTSVMKVLTLGKLKLPETSTFGDTTYSDSRINMRFMNDGKKRHLFCDFKKFDKDKTLYVDLELSQDPEESMVIATPFKDHPKAFYYNQKINCLRAEGKVRYGDDVYYFKKDDSFGVLDWGRGVWTYKNTWYWGSLSCLIDGKDFGFNIGYGFGDTSAASENMLFYEGKAHKLEQITFNIPQKDGKDDFLSPWTFTSSDGRLELSFKPIIDRCSITNALLIASYQHQVFGLFSGFAILDDGRKIEIKNKMGFAEKVHNRW